MNSFALIGELLKKGKRFAVSYIVADCLQNKDPESSVLLHNVAEYLLNPTEKINKADVIEWIRWLLGAGKNPDEFTKEGKLGRFVNRSTEIRICPTNRSLSLELYS